MRMRAPVVLLFSGGIDSTALLDIYKKNDEKIYCVHLSYGQKNEKSEYESVKKITKYYDIDFFHHNIKFPLTYRRNEVIGRNAFFIFSAASLDIKPCRISLGIHGGTDYYDCSENFIINC